MVKGILGKNFIKIFTFSTAYNFGSYLVWNGKFWIKIAFKMINEFWTKWQLWPKNVINHILQSLYNFISTLEHEPSNILARGWVSKKSDEDAEGVETAKTLKTLNYVRKAIEKWKEKVDQNKAKRGEPRTFSKKSSKSSRSPKKSRY